MYIYIHIHIYVYCIHMNTVYIYMYIYLYMKKKKSVASIYERFLLPLSWLHIVPCGGLLPVPARQSSREPGGRPC